MNPKGNLPALQKESFFAFEGGPPGPPNSMLKTENGRLCKTDCAQDFGSQRNHRIRKRRPFLWSTLSSGGPGGRQIEPNWTKLKKVPQIDQNWPKLTKIDQISFKFGPFWEATFWTPFGPLFGHFLDTFGSDFGQKLFGSLFENFSTFFQKLFNFWNEK